MRRITLNDGKFWGSKMRGILAPLENQKPRLFQRLIDWRSDMTLTEAVIIVGCIAIMITMACVAVAL